MEAPDTSEGQHLPEAPGYPRVALIGDVDREIEVATSEEEGAVVLTIATTNQSAGLGLTAEECADLRTALATAEKQIAGLTTLEPGQVWELSIDGEPRQFRVTAVREGTEPLEFELARHDGPTALRDQRSWTTEHPEAHGGVLVGMGPP